MSGSRAGLLLVNLGTPDRPETREVRAYLREFLFDPRVIDLPAWRRWLVLNLLILPFRPQKSAEAYRAVWTERGSPLLVHGQDLAAKVQALLGRAVQVELAMRYGRPTIAAALDRFAAAGIERIVCFPLYPQYASSSVGSTIEAVMRLAAARWNTSYLHFVPPFYDHQAFIAAFAESAQDALRGFAWERVLMSFHGLPERHVRKGDSSGAHCFASSGCCDAIGPANRACYRAQCFATARALGDALGIPEETRLVCFQSRLGRDPWLRPYTDETVVALAKSGVKRVTVLSPAFAADCLETLEELGIRAAEDFRHHGGETLKVGACPNASDTFARAVITIAQESCSWLRGDLA